MTTLDTNHIRKLIITKVRYIACFLLPRIPNDGIGKIVLLNPHFSSGNHIRDYVLRLRVLIDPVGPLTDRHNVATLLEDLVVSRLVDESAPMESRNLASSNIRHLKVSVQEQIKAKRVILARIVDADIEVQLFLSQD